MLALAMSTLCFSISLNEDRCVWWVYGDGERVDLGTRSFNYTLLTLARARLEDANHPSLPPASHGWRNARILARGLHLDPTTLRVHLFRARRQLADAGIRGSAWLIERRVGAGQIRIGTDRLMVTQGGQAWRLTG